MAFDLGSIILHPETAEQLRLSRHASKHHHLFLISPGHQYHNSVAVTLGVILSGPRNLSHLALIEYDDASTMNYESKYLSETLYACETNKLIGVSKGFNIIKSRKCDDFDILLGITEDTSFIGMKHQNIVDSMIVGTNNKYEKCNKEEKCNKDEKLTSDLLEIANLQERPKRKKKCLDKVTVNGVVLKPRVAHQAAYAWLKDIAKDDVIIDFTSSHSNSMIRRFQIKNNHGDYVIVRTLRECLEKVQQKTGRNFYKELEKGVWKYVTEENMEKEEDKKEEVEKEEEREIEEQTEEKGKDDMKTTDYNAYLFGSDSDNNSDNNSES